MELRQAVVIIHGIGEQRPMDTLRGFAEAILEDRDDGRPKFWSKPDFMSESFELRRLTTASTDARPRTDFYEYYWAYLMDGTTFRHVLAWFRTLLFRRPGHVPPRLRWLWWLTWILLALAAYFAASGYFSEIALPPLRKGGYLIAAASSALVGILHTVVLLYIGDAARYLNPAPQNIAVRHEIRKNGIDLLRKLHDSSKYDRIVVVGHSLGSVIGFDILKHFWAEVHRRYEAKRGPDLELFAKVEEAAGSLQKAPSDSTRAVYRKEQQQLWLEQRRRGNPWRVSDFVTLGSPLSHAALLLAEDPEDLEARKNERELPTCPPVREPGADGVPRFTYTWRGDTHLHHAALFAPTRWTNLYFAGDVIGGPMKEALGAGVEDVRLARPGWSRCPASHTKYWKAEPRKAEHLERLREAVNLDCKKWLSQALPGNPSRPDAPAQPDKVAAGDGE